MIGYFDVAVPIGAPTPGRGPRLGLATAEARRKQAEELVRRMDTNKDGKLQKSEVPPRLQGLFKTVDADGNGEVTLDELQKAGQLLQGR